MSCLVSCYWKCLVVFRVLIYVSYLSVSEEVQCYLYILQFVESHATLFPGLREENTKSVA